jgi:hypothetical protein
MNARVSFLLLALVSTAGCSALTPITTLLDIGEAHEAVQKDKEQPTTITTRVTKKNGEIVVESDSDKSIVGTPITNPDSKPTFSTEKAVSSVPTWLYVLVGLSGILFLLNTVRHHYNKKKEVTYDSSRTNNHGWWRTYGRRFQIHRQRSESESRTNEDDDGRSSAESGHRQSGERIRIQIGRRSSE